MVRLTVALTLGAVPEVDAMDDEKKFCDFFFHFRGLKPGEIGLFMLRVFNTTGHRAPQPRFRFCLLEF